MVNYLSELNEIQKKAVTTTEGPVLVVAGPGSGKTRVLTYRIAHIINQGAAPWEVLTLTFTNKAAKEMKERISLVVGDRANSLWAGTFHSVFSRILRVEADKVGYPSSFTIYDSDDTKSLLNSIIKGKGLDPKVYNVNTVRSRISSAKSNIISATAYANDQDKLMEDRMAKIPEVADIYKQYVARCKKAGAMDFDDLLYQLFLLLDRNPDNVREKYQQKFKYVLVDEFQDTNSLQYAILKLLVCYPGSPNNVCVVGDDAQSIYAFRGATIKNILDFQNDFKNLQTFKLEQNYRSTEHIVQAANEVITHNQKQIQKKIWSDKGSGQKIQVVQAMTDSEEGRRIAGMIVEQKTRYHLKNNEIAVLYRTNAQSRVFEEYLRRQNILYRVYGGLSFYQRKEIKDLIAYLRLIVNPMDEEAFKRVINYPKRGIGKTSTEKLTALASQLDKSLWETVDVAPLPNKARNSMLDFKKMIKHFQTKSTKDNAYELASLVARQSGIIDQLKGDTTVEGMGRLDNINALLDGISEFVETDTLTPEGQPEDKSLATYLQSISLLTDQDKEEDVNNSVTLMSVHSAKGLEFKSVFVVGLEEKLFPSFMSMDSQEGLDEERRLFYVAITRAEQFLTLSFARSRYRYGKTQDNRMSRFLMEISPNHLESAGSLHRTKGGGNQGSGGRVSSGVKGNFARNRRSSKPSVVIDPKNFHPSPSESIQTGMKVLHMRFGEGKVLSVDGAEASRIATIFFKGIDNPQKKIMLKFAKLQIVT